MTALFYVIRLEASTGEFIWSVTTNLRLEVHRFRNRAALDLLDQIQVYVEGVFMQESTALEVMERLSATDYLTAARRAV